MVKSHPIILHICLGTPGEGGWGRTNAPTDNYLSAVSVSLFFFALKNPAICSPLNCAENWQTAPNLFLLGSLRFRTPRDKLVIVYDESAIRVPRPQSPREVRTGGGRRLQ